MWRVCERAGARMAKKVRVVLDERLRERGMTRYELSKRTGIRFQNVDNYYKNKVVRYDSDLLLRMCTVLECDVGDLLRIVDE